MDENEVFDDFDDFGEEAEAGPSVPPMSLGEPGGEDEGFGDFGDFEEGDFEESVEPAMVEERIVVQEPETMRWVSDYALSKSWVLSPVMWHGTTLWTLRHDR